MLTSFAVFHFFSSDFRYFSLFELFCKQCDVMMHKDFSKIHIIAVLES